MTDTIEVLPGIDEAYSFFAFTHRNDTFDTKIQLRDLTVCTERRAISEGRHLYAASIDAYTVGKSIAIAGYLCRCTLHSAGNCSIQETRRHGWKTYAQKIECPPKTRIPTGPHTHIWHMSSNREATVEQQAAFMRFAGYAPMRLEKALCRQADPDIFFTNRNSQPWQRPALKICACCPVLVKCAREYGRVEKRASTVHGDTADGSNTKALKTSTIQGIAAATTEEIRQCAYWATEGKRRLAKARRELQTARETGAGKTIIRQYEKRLNRLENTIRVAAQAQPRAEKAWQTLTRGILTQRQREKILDALMEEERKKGHIR